MEVDGWLDILVVGGIADNDEGMVEGGREEERDAKGDRPG